MNIHDLINRSIICTCGRTHRCNIGTLAIEKHALQSLGHVAEAYHSILLAADRLWYCQSFLFI